MTSIKLIVNGACARAVTNGILTAGMVGIPLEIEYDEVWDGLTKTVVFSDGTISKAKIDVDTQTTVTHEVMNAGLRLLIGVEGRNADGTLVLPTVWADAGKIRSSADVDADESADPTQPIWAQILEKLENANLNETDPTVPDWAKQPTKPAYTAQEVGALPDTYKAPVQTVNGAAPDENGNVEITIPDSSQNLEQRVSDIEVLLGTSVADEEGY